MGAIGASGAVDSALVRAAEDDTEKSAILLKKSLAAEKDLVDTLLPSPGQPGSKLNIQA